MRGWGAAPWEFGFWVNTRELFHLMIVSRVLYFSLLPPVSCLALRIIRQLLEQSTLRGCSTSFGVSRIIYKTRCAKDCQKTISSVSTYVRIILALTYYHRSFSKFSSWRDCCRPLQFNCLVIVLRKF